MLSVQPLSQKPQIVSVRDEVDQATYVTDQILARREVGTQLKSQAVLFRSASHSVRLEIELTRRNIPFVKFGGLKFLEARHVKDVLAILRWAQNPLDRVSGFRAIQLLPTGMSPEGLATITRRADGRSLLVAANEGDGSLTLFEHHAQGARPHQRVLRVQRVQVAQVDLRRVGTGQADVAITSPRPAQVPTLWRVLYVERLCLAVPSDHRLVGRARVRLAEVADERVLQDGLLSLLGAGRFFSVSILSAGQSETAGDAAGASAGWPWPGVSGGVIASSLGPEGPKGIRRTEPCGPWRGARPAPDGRLWWPCGRGNRGGACGPGSTVGKCASSRLSIRRLPEPARIRGR